MKIVWIVERIDNEYEGYTDGVVSVHKSRETAQGKKELLESETRSRRFVVTDYEVKP